MPNKTIPDGDEMTPWGKTRQELYDEGVARFEAAKTAGQNPDPMPWLAKGRGISDNALKAANAQNSPSVQESTTAK